MLGVRTTDIHLTPEERGQFENLLESLNRSRNACQEILGNEVNMLEKQLRERDLTPKDVEELSFNLASTSGEATKAALLKSDRFLLARFAAASNIIADSANKMRASELRNESLVLQRYLKNTTSVIKQTLERNDINPAKPRPFKGLEDTLNKETESFLGLEETGRSGDATDSKDFVLLSVVRNSGIIQDLQEMLVLFSNHIGTLSKPSS